MDNSYVQGGMKDGKVLRRSGECFTWRSPTVYLGKPKGMKVGQVLDELGSGIEPRLCFLPQPNTVGQHGEKRLV
jgi:hypothetical protein